MVDLTRLAEEYGVAQDLSEIAHDLVEWGKTRRSATPLKNARKMKTTRGKA